MKRLLKGPWLWIVVAVVGVLIALQYLTPSDGHDEITTSEMQQYITSGQVKEITFIDGDQLIKATLDQGVDREGGNQVQAHYIQGQQTGHHRRRSTRRSPTAPSRSPTPRTPSPACSARSWRRCCPSP